MLKLNHVEIVIEWDIWSIDSIDPMPVSCQPQPLPSLIETSIRLVRSSSSDSLTVTAGIHHGKVESWELFLRFFPWGCIPPPKKKRELKPPIFWWMTYSKSGVTDKKNNHLTRQWIFCLLKSVRLGLRSRPNHGFHMYIYIYVIYVHISQPPGNSAWQMFFLYWSSTVYVAFIGHPETICRLSNFDQMTTIYHLQHVEGMHPWWVNLRFPQPGRLEMAQKYL